MKVLIPVDNSGFSRAALESVTERCWSDQSEMTILSVVEPAIPPYEGWHESYFPILEDAQRELVARCKEMIKGYVEYLQERLPDCKVTGEVLEGNVRQCIIERAKELECDFIVMASHGRTGFMKVLLGSVAQAVVTAAPCSVLIVRPPQSAEQRAEMEQKRQNVEFRKSVVY